MNRSRIWVDGREALSWRSVARFYRICERTLAKRQQDGRLPPADVLYGERRFWFKSTLQGLKLRTPTAKAKWLVIREPPPLPDQHWPVTSEPDA